MMGRPSDNESDSNDADSSDTSGEDEDATPRHARKRDKAVIQSVPRPRHMNTYCTVLTNPRLMKVVVDRRGDALLPTAGGTNPKTVHVRRLAIPELIPQTRPTDC